MHPPYVSIYKLINVSRDLKYVIHDLMTGMQCKFKTDNFNYDQTSGHTTFKLLLYLSATAGLPRSRNFSIVLVCKMIKEIMIEE